MGQAKLRGTKEARVADAEAASEQLRHERRLKEAERERAIQERWNAMTKAEQEQRLQQASEEARFYGELAADFGHDAAGLIMAVSRSAKKC